MLIIAEKINIMSKTIGPAMRNREKGPIHELAIAQVKGGARWLDLNLGPATKDGPGMMQEHEHPKVHAPSRGGGTTCHGKLVQVHQANARTM